MPALKSKLNFKFKTFLEEILKTWICPDLKTDPKSFNLVLIDELIDEFMEQWSIFWVVQMIAMLNFKHYGSWKENTDSMASVCPVQFICNINLQGLHTSDPECVF